MLGPLKSKSLPPVKRAKSCSQIRNGGAQSDGEELSGSNLSVSSSSVDSVDDINVHIGESFSKCEKLKRNKAELKTEINEYILSFGLLRHNYTYICVCVSGQH